MEIRQYNEKEHLPIIHEWQRKRGNKYISVSDALPQLGFMAYNKNSVPITSVFVYRTDSSIVFFEHLTSNPDSTKEERKQAIEKTMEFASSVSKELGYKYVYSRTEIPTVQSRLVENGHIHISSNQSIYLGVL